MIIYRFRVSLFGEPDVYRIIDLSENCTFQDLHKIIFKAFDRYDEHLYSFFITGKDTKSFRKIYDSLEIADPIFLEETGYENERISAAETAIWEVDLRKGTVFHYVFDFGDEWWHRIKVEDVFETNLRRKKYKKLVKSVGESPPQYPEYDEEEDWDEDEDWEEEEEND